MFVPLLRDQITAMVSFVQFSIVGCQSIFSSTMEIQVPDNCGNSPRKLMLQEFNVALASGDVEGVVSHVADDIEWKLVGDQQVSGKPAFEKALQGSNMKVARLKISNIITHGTTAAVDGELELDNGFQLAFCDVYRFTGSGAKAKIKEITAYVVSSQAR